MDDTSTTCARHPDTRTRLSCTACGAPICPRCSVATPVGQKCPDCARLPRSARARGKPQQYAKAVAAGLGVVALAAVALQFIITTVGFGSVIGSGFGGFAVARAVRWGGEGNTAEPFRYGAVVLSLVMVAAGWWLWGGGPGGIVVALRQSLFTLLTYVAAAYGAVLGFR